MSPVCPISQNRIDTNIVRTISFFTVCAALMFLLFDHTFFVYLLLGDFSLRFFRLQKWSPFFQISTKILQTLPLKPMLCDEAPKRFALTLGWLMTLLIAIFTLGSFATLASVFAGVLLVCAALEMLFDYCIGCKLYQFLHYFKKEDAC